jgi:hypothetical protein
MRLIELASEELYITAKQAKFIISKISDSVQRHHAVVSCFHVCYSLSQVFKGEFSALHCGH